MLEMADHDTIREEGYRHRVDPLRKGLCLLPEAAPKESETVCCESITSPHVRHVILGLFSLQGLHFALLSSLCLYSFLF